MLEIPRLPRLGVTIFAGVVLLSCSLASGEGVIPRRQHPWGRFGVGSWKRVRMHTENLDDTGKVTSESVTETTTRMIAADVSGYTLRIDVVVEVAGKRYPSQPQTVWKGFGGQVIGQKMSWQSVGNEDIVVNGIKIPTQIRQLDITGGDVNRSGKVYYSARHAPYVLRRRMSATDAVKDTEKYSSQVDVLALKMPYRVLSEMKEAAYVRTILKHSTGKSVTLETQCQEVPGALVAHTSKEMDNEGRVTRRTTLELVDFAVVESDMHMSYRRGRSRRRTRVFRGAR